MIRYIFKRLLHSIPLIIAITIISFFIVHWMPGDPIRTMLGDKAPEEQVVRMREELNLDKPLYEQFQIWLKELVRMDFGESIMWKESVVQIVKSRIEPTFLLALIGIIISVLLGVPLGIVSARVHGKFMEKILSVLSLLSISLPAFWIAIIMIQIFGVKFQVFPVAGYHTIENFGILIALKDLMLPGLVLGIMHSGQIGRMTKASMLEIMKQDYLKTARASGISEHIVLNYYALKPALTSVVVVIGFSFAALLAGAVVIEQIFNIPGIGNLTITAILNRDYPVIQVVLLFIAIIFIIVNIITDIVCAFINPKVRYENE